MSLHYSFEYELSEDLSARVAEAFLRNRRKQVSLDAKFWKAMSVLLLCALVSAAFLTIGYQAEIPIAILFIPAAFSGLFGGVLFLVMFSIISARVIEGISGWLIRRRLRANISRLNDRQVRWTFTDEGFHVHTADKDSQVSWNAVRPGLADAEFWFLSVKGSPDLILPTEKLSDEVKELIHSKAANLPADTAPSTELSTTQTIRNSDIRQGPARKTPFGRFVFFVVTFGITIFLLQKNQMVEADSSLEKPLMIGALILGACFAIALLVKRALKSAKVTAEKMKFDRL